MKIEERNKPVEKEWDLTLTESELKELHSDLIELNFTNRSHLTLYKFWKLIPMRW